MKDVIERAASTFVQAAVGVIVASNGFGVQVWKAAAVAGGIALAKAFAARKVGDPDSAGVAK